MSKFLSMNVTGAKRMALKMNGLADDLRGEVLLVAAQAAALGVEGEAKLRVPRDTGATAAGIKRRVIKSEPNIAVVAVVAERSEVHKRRPIPMWVEFGTSRTPAQPFLRPALRESRSTIRRTIGTVIGQVLRRRFGI